MVPQWLLRFLWVVVRVPLFLLLGTVGGFGRAREIDPRKVAIYIRWSTDDQGSGTTLDVQRDACLAQARAWGFGTIPDDRIFIDDGYSGGDLKRPAITRLRELISQRHIHCVIVYKIDRLSRNIVDATSLVLQEWDGVCDLRCVMEPIDTTTELGRVIFSILATFADFERQTIRARTATGRVRRAAEGRNPGIRLPYGYRHGLNTGEIVVDEHQAAVVRRIFEAYASGRGCIAIASELNQEGMTGWSGQAWSQSTIQKMLTNQAYIGRMIYGRSTRNRRRDTAGGPVRLRLDEPAVVRDNAFPPIVPLELFQRCQQVRQARTASLKRTSGRALASPYLLTGLVRCKCGHALRIWKPGSSTPNKRPAYVCEGRTTKGQTFCDAARINQELLENLVLEEVRKLTRPDFRSAFLEQYRSSLQAQIHDLEAQIAGAEARLKQLDAQERGAYQDYRAGQIGAATLEHLLKAIAEDRQQTAAGLDGLRERVEEARRAVETQVALEASLDRVDTWDQLTPTARKQLLRDLIRDLVAYRPPGTKDLEIRISYKILDDLAN